MSIVRWGGRAAQCQGRAVTNGRTPGRATVWPPALTPGPRRDPTAGAVSGFSDNSLGGSSRVEFSLAGTVAKACSTGDLMPRTTTRGLCQGALVLMWAATGRAEPMAVNDIERFEAKVLAARRAIDRCQIEISCRYSDAAGKPLPERDMDLHYWLNGSQIRLDQVHEPSLPSRARSVDCWHAEQPGLHFAYHPYKAGAAMIMADFRPMADTDEAVRKPSDPRSLGLIPLPLVNCYGSALDRVVGRRDRKNLVGRRHGTPENEFVTIEYDTNATVKCKLLIGTTGEPRVERVEWVFAGGAPGEPPALHYVLESRYDHKHPQHRAFPSSFVYTEHKAGKHLEKHEGIVNVVSVGVPIDPKQFTLKGFDLPNKTVVTRVPPDGRSVVVMPGGFEAYDPQKHAFEGVPPAGGARLGWRLRWGLIASSMIMLGGGVFYFVRRYRNSSGGPAPVARSGFQKT